MKFFLKDLWTSQQFKLKKFEKAKDLIGEGRLPNISIIYKTQPTPFSLWSFMPFADGSMGRIIIDLAN